MDAKSLKKLNRRELLELMVQISEENEALAHENEVLKAEIENRKLSAKEVGSLAQAALDANNFFIAAEKSAKLYLENIARMEQETKERCSKLLEEALADCITKRADAGFSADNLVPPSWGGEGNIETRLAQEVQQVVNPEAVPIEGLDMVFASSDAVLGQSEENQDLTGSEQEANDGENQEVAANEVAAAHAKEKRGLFGRKKKS